MIRRAAVAATLVVTALALTAGVASAQIMATEEAVELANVLAEAYDEQDICYGWEVSVRDDGSGPDFVDVGSSSGPGVAVNTSVCERYIVFSASLHYTSELSESYDSASFGIVSNIPNAPTEDDLRRLGINGDGLLGDNDDMAVLNATGALPLLAAEKGLAPPLPDEPVDAGSDRPTDTPGSDFLRDHLWQLVLCGLIVAAGVLWLLYALFASPYYH